MMQANQRVLWIFLAVAVFFGAVWQFFPLSDAAWRLNGLPLRGVNFSGTEVPLNDFEVSFFHDVNMVKRIYRVGSQECFLTVLDGTHNRHAVHDPSYCFTGSGWRIIQREPMNIRGGTADLIKMEKDGQYREAVLWFSDGSSRHASAFQFFLQSTFRRLTLGKLSEAPVLIMIQPRGTKPLDWAELLKMFDPIQEL